VQVEAQDLVMAPPAQDLAVAQQFKARPVQTPWQTVAS
jgi:hypothetical protein